MNGKAFIEMQRQDLVTYTGKEPLAAVVDAMEAVIKEHPGADIDATKTAEELYKKMAEKARVEKIACFAGEALKKFIVEYLGLNVGAGGGSNASDDINLEDFF